MASSLGKKGFGEAVHNPQGPGHENLVSFVLGSLLYYVGAGHLMALVWGLGFPEIFMDTCIVLGKGASNYVGRPSPSQLLMDEILHDFYYAGHPFQTLNLNIVVRTMPRNGTCANDRNPASSTCARNIEI